MTCTSEAALSPIFWRLRCLGVCIPLSLIDVLLLLVPFVQSYAGAHKAVSKAAGCNSDEVSPTWLGHACIKKWGSTVCLCSTKAIVMAADAAVVDAQSSKSRYQERAPMAPRQGQGASTAPHSVNSDALSLPPPRPGE